MSYQVYDHLAATGAEAMWVFFRHLPKSNRTYSLWCWCCHMGWKSVTWGGRLPSEEETSSLSQFLFGNSTVARTPTVVLGVTLPRVPLAAQPTAMAAQPTATSAQPTTQASSSSSQLGHEH